MHKIELIPLNNFPLINAKDSIANIIAKNYKETLQQGDILVLAQKIISKAENRIINLKDLNISNQAIELAKKTGRSAEFCQAIINESAEIIKTKGKVIVTKMPNGMILTSAGIDKSNIDTKNNSKVILLPKDSDKSAKEIYYILKSELNLEIPIIINDSLGHPYRGGSIGNAIGLYGLNALDNYECKDLNGNNSKPIINKADELSAAASIIMGQANEGIPAVIVRGANYTKSNTSSINDIII